MVEENKKNQKIYRFYIQLGFYIFWYRFPLFSICLFSDVSWLNLLIGNEHSKDFRVPIFYSHYILKLHFTYEKYPKWRGAFHFLQTFDSNTSSKKKKINASREKVT
jgi:hypothetical protein